MTPPVPDPALERVAVSDGDGRVVGEGGWMEVEELRRRLSDRSRPFVPDGRTAARRWLNSGITDG